MTFRRTTMLMVLATLCACVAIAQAQDGGGRDRGRGRGDRGSRGGPGEPGGFGGPGGFGDRGGPGGRSFGRGPSPFTPEGREQFLNEAVNRSLERYSRSYGLNDQQKEQVKQKLEQFKAQDRALAEKRQPEIDNLRNQFSELRRRREAGEQIDPQQYRNLFEQMRSMGRDSMLMNREKVTAEVESLLPPEQVAQGRQRHEEEHAREEQRREEMRQRWQQWQQQGGGDPREFWRQQREQSQAQPGQDQSAQDPNAQPQPDSDRRRRGFRDRGSDRDQSQDQERDGRNRDRGDRDTDNDGRDRRGRGDDRRREAEARLQQASPLGPWESYVRDFIIRYQLDASQQAIALSALRDLSAQRKAFEEAKRDDLAAAKEIQDADLRKKQIEFLSAPVSRLFDELKSKLDRIPTLAQRQLTDGPPRQFLMVTTQPAGRLTTLPADGNRGNWTRDRSDSGRFRGDSSRFRGDGGRDRSDVGRNRNDSDRNPSDSGGDQSDSRRSRFNRSRSPRSGQTQSSD